MPGLEAGPACCARCVGTQCKRKESIGEVKPAVCFNLRLFFIMSKTERLCRFLAICISCPRPLPVVEVSAC